MLSGITRGIRDETGRESGLCVCWGGGGRVCVSVCVCFCWCAWVNNAVYVSVLERWVRNPRWCNYLFGLVNNLIFINCIYEHVSPPLSLLLPSYYPPSPRLLHPPPSSSSTLLVIKIAVMAYLFIPSVRLLHLQISWLVFIKQSLVFISKPSVRVTGLCWVCKYFPEPELCIINKTSMTVMTRWTTQLTKLIGHNYRSLQAISHCQVVITVEWVEAKVR